MNVYCTIYHIIVFTYEGICTLYIAIVLLIVFLFILQIVILPPFSSNKYGNVFRVYLVTNGVAGRIVSIAKEDSMKGGRRQRRQAQNRTWLKRR